MNPDIMNKQYNLNVDLDLLRKQKLLLAQIVQGEVTSHQPQHADIFEGILSLLEAIGDQAE